MEIHELSLAVEKYIDRLNLKSPRTRKGAAAKILGFIRNSAEFCGNNGVILPNDKTILARSYTRWKGADMNGAEKSALNHIYECFNGTKQNISVTKVVEAKPVIREESVCVTTNDIESELIGGQFVPVSAIVPEMVPGAPGLYCIKLREGVSFPKDFGTIRKDRIIYIGKAEDSTLRERLWEEELNCRRPATFFRSIGAMLGYLPPKGSLAGKTTRNYKFSPTNSEQIREWMRQSLLVNCLPVKKSAIETEEKRLIVKYSPLVNIKDNPLASEEIKKARERCVSFARGEEI